MSFAGLQITTLGGRGEDSLKKTSIVCFCSHTVLVGRVAGALFGVGEERRDGREGGQQRGMTMIKANCVRHTNVIMKESILHN